MSPEPSTEILLVGEPSGDDLNAAVDHLHGLVRREAIGPLPITRQSIAPQSIAQLVIHQAAHIDAAIDQLHSATGAPAWVVVLQSWPGQIPAADIDRLRRAAPLARICGVLGSWCEGETRSGKPWPGTLRCSWIAWADLLSREIAGVAAGHATPWSLPETASMEEMLLAAIGPEAKMISTPGGTTPRDVDNTAPIAVVARSRETRMALTSAIEARGYQSIALADPSAAAIPQAASLKPQASTLKPQAALWNTSPEAACDAAVVRRVLAAVDGAPLLALIGFPRADDVARAHAAGVAAVIAKPYLLDDVFWRLERLSRPRAAALQRP